MATGSDSMLGQSTPEYRTLREHYQQVIDHVKELTGTICNALFSKGYITSEKRDSIRCSENKAEKLTDTLIDTIKYNRKVFPDFIDILKNEGSWANDIVECLEQTYCAYSKESEKLQQATGHSVATDTIQEASSCVETNTVQCLRFVCPSCSRCPPRRYFSRNGCSQVVRLGAGNTRSLFPFLDCSNDEKFLLKGQLVQDTTEIFELFEDMVDSLIRSLESKGVHISQLRLYVSSEVKKHGSKNDIKWLERATSISDVFYALSSFKSFFHYEIIQRIVKRFGRNSDKRKLEEYIAKFKQYCKRNVFEVPSNIFCNREPEAGSRCFVFKLLEDGPKSLQDIDNMRWKIAKILKIDVLSLQLCSVTTGCVCLNFLATEQEAEEITTKIAGVKETAFEDLHIKFLGESDIPEHSAELSKKKPLVNKVGSQTAKEKTPLVKDCSSTEVNALYQLLILSNGAAAKDELKRFNFKKNLEALLVQLLESECLKLVHIDKLIKHSESVNMEKFTNAMKQISIKAGGQLIRFCQQENELLEKVLLLLSYNEEQILEFIKVDEDEFCCNLFETNYMHSQSKFIMQKVSKISRTQYLLKTVRTAEIEKTLIVLDSGEIIPEKIDLRLLAKKVHVLTSIDLLSKLLENGVNASGFITSGATPLTILVKQYPRDTHKKNFQVRCNTVECMEMLIKAGADVEDLNSYHSGIKTTPIHVATKIALTTGKIEFLKLVFAKWAHDYSSLDGHKQTALHIAAIASKHPTFNFNDVWKYLVNECKVDKSIRDDRRKRAAFYLSEDKREELSEISDDLSATDELETEPKKKPSSQPPLTTQNTSLGDNSKRDADEVVTVFGLLKNVNDSSKTSENDMEQSINPSKEECTEEELSEMVSELLKQPSSYFLDTQNSSSSTVFKQKQSEKPQQVYKTETFYSTSEMSLAESIAEAKWEVELLDHVEKELRKVGSRPALKNSVLSTIKKLANGDWRDKLRIKFKKTMSCIIYKAEIIANNYLLYTFLDRFSERKTTQARECIEKQVYVYTKTIVILDILHGRDDKTHHAKRVLRILSDEKFKQNLASPDEDTDSQYFPQTSIQCEQKLTDVDLNRLSFLRGNISNERNESDIGTKTYSLSTQLVLGLITGQCEQRDYPIKVADDEFDIINKSEDAPIVVLGRSGTGKTTVCLCRLWKKFTAYWDRIEKAADPLIPKIEYETTKAKAFAEQSMGASAQHSCSTTKLEHIHQIFVTKSSKLCNQMKKRFRDFIADYEPAEKQRELLDQIDSLPDPKTFSEVDEMCYPLFLTAEQFFPMLDKSLNDGKEFFQDETPNSTEQPKHSELQPLEVELKKKDCTVKTDKKFKREEVTDDLFQREIWPKILKKSLDSKIDPLLIWMEIQSYIKGSLDALKSPEGVLTKEAYKEFGKKRAPNFPMSRENVYVLFKAYEEQIKHKDIQKCLFDNGDFIHNLYDRIKDSKSKQNWSVHSVYIDEVQDFTQAELSVIIQCCKHPKSCFFSGDTAQTIIKGIAFRFEDLGVIFHSIGERTPELNMLTLNHRSHNGIAQFASTITDLMEYFFPESFDWRNIPNDKSNIIGPKPLFAFSEDSMKSFLDLQSEGEDIRFGANQVVIVRDDEALANIPDSLKQCIVLTINQCKGLEFNDVLLYNFFSDFWDHVGKKVEIWRASTTYLSLEENCEKIAREPYPPSKGIRTLKFDEKQHKSLCAELKYLYTVVTRAKYHLWIFEDLPPNSLPMLDYWYRRDVVQVMSSTSEITELLPTLSTPTSNEDWRKRGEELYKQEIWQEAEKCYKKAKEPLLAKQAHIKIIEQEAKELLRTKTELYKPKLRLAAAEYISCDETQHKTTYLLSLAEHLQQLEKYKQSAELFEKLQKDEIALKIYQFDLTDVDNTVRLMEKLRKYQEAIDYACRYRQSLALKLTSQYEQDGNLSKDDKEEIADREIKKFTKLRELKKAKPWLRFISNKKVYITAKKKESRIVAFRVLEILKEYDSALIYARAQAMCTEGIKLATEIGRPDMVTIFLLQQATQDIRSSKKIQTKGLLDNLDRIATTHKDLHIVARALVLLARHEGENVSRNERIANCERAHDIYKTKLTNQFGEIECYNVLRGLKKEENLHTRIKETTFAIQKVNETNRTAELENKLVIFFGFEKDKSEIFIPKNQDQWRIGYEKLQNQIPNEDDMVRVHFKDVYELVQNHLEQYANTWLDEEMNRLDTNFRACGFSCHNDIKKKQPVRKSFSVAHSVERYTFLFELENEIVNFAEKQKMRKTFSRKWICKPIDTLVQMLSPYSQVYLQYTKEEYTAIRESSLKPILIKRLKELDFRKDSFDNLLKAWQIHTALNLVDEVHLPEDKHRVYGNCISVWLQSNRLLRKGENILQAIEKSVQCFAENVKRCDCLENVTATLTVYTTALLTMLSYSGKVELLMPETFLKFVNNFDTINSKQLGVDLYEACITEAKNLEAQEVNKKVLTILREILKLLLENFREEIRLGQLEAPEDYAHTLMLTLTIFGSLILYTDLNKLRGVFEKILHLYANIPTGLSEAYTCLAETKTVRDLFWAIKIVVEKMEMNVMKLNIEHQEEADSMIAISICKFHEIPCIDLPLLEDGAYQLSYSTNR